MSEEDFKRAAKIEGPWVGGALALATAIDVFKDDGIAPDELLWIPANFFF